jgi:acetyl-CoA carboxylase biotin carboxyl carrier protein
MPLSYDDISGLLKIIDSSSCEELILETSDIKLVVRKRSANGADVRPAPIYQSQAQAGSHLASTPAASSPATADGNQNSAGAVRSPMVGTFYRAPSPDAPPFVEVGSKVKKGDPLCIIEVMKLFTTVHAEFGGQVVKIAVENGAFVEYGQTLLVVTPDADGNSCQSQGG